MNLQPSPQPPRLHSRVYAASRKRGSDAAAAAAAAAAGGRRGMSSIKQARTQSMLSRLPAWRDAALADGAIPLDADAVEDDDDGDPFGGRFNLDLNDKDDRACVPRKAKPGERQEILARFAEQRKARMHDVLPEEEEEEEEKQALTVEQQCEAVYARLRGTTEQAREDALVRQRVHTRVHLATDKLAGANVKKGDIILAKIRECLNNMGYVRSEYQALFHSKFMSACLPHIYGNEWSECSERVMKEFDIDRISYEILIQTPRRFGKVGGPK